jgi:hypothetical protein
MKKNGRARYEKAKAILRALRREQEAQPLGSFLLVYYDPRANGRSLKVIGSGWAKHAALAKLADTWDTGSHDGIRYTFRFEQ